MLKEIAPALADENISPEEAKQYAHEVLDRFRNPYLEHKWLNITLQYTSKMLMRNVPNILNHYAKNNAPPKLMALGFAGYIRFMQGEKNELGQYIGHTVGKTFVINDDRAALLHRHYARQEKRALVYEILADEMLWGRDLTKLFEFADTVTTHLYGLLDANNNVRAYIQSVV
jgi:tagaturonate reductase